MSLPAIDRLQIDIAELQEMFHSLFEYLPDRADKGRRVAKGLIALATELEAETGATPITDEYRTRAAAWLQSLGEGRNPAPRIRQRKTASMISREQRRPKRPKAPPIGD